MADDGITFTRQLHAELIDFGFEWVRESLPMERVRAIEGTSAIDHWRWKERMMFTSRGCSNFSDKGSRYRDEFIVHSFCDESIALEVLSYVMFFHMARRSLKPTDLLEIGETRTAVEDYTHVFVSVPFFLPGRINQIALGEQRLSLSWLMPISPVEARFIETRGANEFEERLKASNYDYFDRRTDQAYLGPT